MTIDAIMRMAPVIPVLVINDVAQVLRLLGAELARTKIIKDQKVGSRHPVAQLEVAIASSGHCLMLQEVGDRHKQGCLTLFARQQP